MATSSYERMADSLYECNWFELPVQMQKCLMIMIMKTQKPIYYHGFRVAVLDLATFNKVSE